VSIKGSCILQISTENNRYFEAINGQLVPAGLKPVNWG